MDNINIEGVALTPLKKIHHPKGDIYHGIKKSDNGYITFGEAYFSTIIKGEIKGWKKHKKMTLNLIVPIGEIRFVIYDDRINSSTKGQYFKVKLSSKNYQRLTVPNGVWMAFEGISNNTNLVFNLADIEHEPEEIDRCNLSEIKYPNE